MVQVHIEKIFLSLLLCVCLFACAPFALRNRPIPYIEVELDTPETHAKGKICGSLLNLNGPFSNQEEVFSDIGYTARVDVFLDVLERHGGELNNVQLSIQELCLYYDGFKK